MLNDRDFKWDHSKHRGYFIGMKLSFSLEYPGLKPSSFIKYEANVSEYRIYPQILEELSRRKNIRARDIELIQKPIFVPIFIRVSENFPDQELD